MALSRWGCAKPAPAHMQKSKRHPAWGTAQELCRVKIDTAILLVLSHRSLSPGYQKKFYLKKTFHTFFGALRRERVIHITQFSFFVRAFFLVYTKRCMPETPLPPPPAEPPPVQESSSVPETATQQEKRCIFSGLIPGGKTSLPKARTVPRISWETVANAYNREKAVSLFDQVLRAYNSGGKILLPSYESPDFQKNFLPAHSEFHIAKVMRIATGLDMSKLTNVLKTQQIVDKDFSLDLANRMKCPCAYACCFHPRPVYPSGRRGPRAAGRAVRPA